MNCIRMSQWIVDSMTQSLGQLSWLSSNRDDAMQSRFLEAVCALRDARARYALPRARDATIGREASRRVSWIDDT